MVSGDVEEANIADRQEFLGVRASEAAIRRLELRVAGVELDHGR